MTDTVDPAEHPFGGAWTELKLRAVADYLVFYTRALQCRPSVQTPFQKWYIDAFAGTGERTEERTAGGLLEGEPDRRERFQLEGSARRALKVEPSFQHYVFIEASERRFRALEKLSGEYADKDVRCMCGDANAELRKLFASAPWPRGGARAGLQRAVVFLDPYGMNVRWETLKLLADSKRADVWYLFPLHAALRQLAHEHGAVDETKRAALTEVFGTADWEEEFYREAQEARDLFDLGRSSRERVADPGKVESFARRRLQTIFTFVSDPIPLLARRGLHQFSLFLATGNESPQAIDLIKRGVAAQVKKYGGQASRHTSGH
ncbi:MAG: three-Cys-motif partner protein TcmP [Sphingomicrobium sp.]|nr:three-Cys-motif partner protein TcmP [Sphingomonadales bacterium]